MLNDFFERFFLVSSRFPVALIECKGKQKTANSWLSNYLELLHIMLIKSCKRKSICPLPLNYFPWGLPFLHAIKDLQFTVQRFHHWLVLLIFYSHNCEQAIILIAMGFYRLGSAIAKQNILFGLYQTTIISPRIPV